MFAINQQNVEASGTFCTFIYNYLLGIELDIIDHFVRILALRLDGLDVVYLLSSKY